MRLIDADALKEKILAERDAIPKTYVERYGFGVEFPNQHGNSMRGGIRKALRCLEQTPTIDPESLRPKGEWIKYETDESWGVEDYTHWFKCSECGKDAGGRVEGDERYSYPVRSDFCPNCGADMRGEKNA